MTLSTIIKKRGKINFDKSKFNLQKVKYLGYIIDKDGYTADRNKIIFKKMNPQGITIRQLQKQIGAMNWFRKFTPNLSEKMIFITNKLKNKPRR